MEGGVGTKAPERPEYVNLSEYPPGTDIEYELHYDGCRVVSKVPRWAHEKWLLKYQNAGDPEEDHPQGTIPPEDTSPSGKRPCVDQPSETADDDDAFDIHAIKRLWEADVEIPSETAAAYAEMIRLEPAFAYVFPDLYSYHDYPDRYRFCVKDGRTVVKLNKWAGPRVPGITSKVEDPSAGAKVENHLSPADS
ncbi:uncharacterized protein LOC110883550 isoform X2 [Helianthus annuus]|uniref:uncharacterized protein LOC110883550 isoform X2 n=1 Tax=Helianthus annuus TaxID=4232 RepID=UPI000B901535|nr:uncharacterized protein LOC110883550 isoform X2 [Helianthus annuus]